ncbi:MAG: YegP family protein [Solimonas sp.]
MAGAFEISKAKSGQYHFNLKAGNGEIILSSEMYETKDSALNGVASVQKNCTQSERYGKEISSSGKPYFTLKAANHQVIGSSQMYTSAAMRDAGIESVKTNGVTTVIRDAA